MSPFLEVTPLRLVDKNLCPKDNLPPFKSQTHCCLEPPRLSALVYKQKAIIMGLMTPGT